MAVSGIKIPQANLRPILRATAKEWRANLNRVMARAHFILGDELRAFEQEFASKMGARFAIGVSSGSAAIELSLREAGIRGEVLTTALTAPFTAVSIKAAGYTPRFCDIDPETLQIDAADAARRVTAKTRAIVPVHLYRATMRYARDRENRIAGDSGCMSGTWSAAEFFDTRGL